MAEKKLFDNLYKVIKGNSGEISANDGVFTEIFDLQIPRGYCARIRRVIFDLQVNADQANQEWFRVLGALVLDPDDETTTQIPTFTVDHDVLCDTVFEKHRQDEDTTPNGISALFTPRDVHDFSEEIDVVTVRNVRFNIIATGLATGGDNNSQMRCTVYFTYEKISADLYSKLLGIS